MLAFSFSLMLVNSLTMLFTKSSILMMILIILQTFVVCVMTKIITNVTWISFILFLVFVGGLLVLFIYIISLTPNTQLVTDSMKIFAISASLLMMLLMKTTFSNILFTQKFKTLNVTNYLLLTKLYSYASLWATFMAMTYLLLVLIVVVYIVLVNRSSMKSLLIKS